MSKNEVKEIEITQQPPQPSLESDNPWKDLGKEKPTRKPRAMNADTPGLGDPGTSIQSIYGTLNSTNTAYRIGLQLAIVLLICNFVLIIVYIEYTYPKDFDEMMMQYRNKPLKLLSIFFAAYVIGCVILIPPSTILIICAYTFTHIWGLWMGCFYCFWFNLFC